MKELSIQYRLIENIASCSTLNTKKYKYKSSFNLELVINEV